jgi:hypothetical protein
MNWSKLLQTAGVVLVVVASLVLPRQATAQVNPQRFGTWKLDVAKSKYSPGPPPKAQTRKEEPSGDGIKVTVEGIAGNGSKIAYSYIAKYDSRDYAQKGIGMPNGSDTIALKRVDDQTIELILKRKGKVVQNTKSVLSSDGRTLTFTSSGTNPAGQPTNVVSVWSKQ